VSQIKLYLDEDSQDQSLLRALWARQIEQLRLAHREHRVLYSHNIGDFCQLHTEFLTNGEDHSGIALFAQDYSVGEQVRAILEFISNQTAESMLNQLQFLSRYMR
jgi:hypothetical protein